jgi:hypothetical protein
MRSHTFSVEFALSTEPDFTNVSTAGTALEGIVPNTPVHATVQEDNYPSGNGGCAIVTVRCPETDVLRFRVNSPTPSLPIVVTVTELL